jgi:transposase
MAEAYPIELRRRLVEAHERGEGGYTVLARRFSVGEATAKRWVWRFRQEGAVA